MIKCVARLKETILEKCVATFTITKIDNINEGSAKIKEYLGKKSAESKKECSKLLFKFLFKNESLLNTDTLKINEEELVVILKEINNAICNGTQGILDTHKTIYKILDTFLQEQTHLSSEASKIADSIFFNNELLRHTNDIRKIDVNILVGRLAKPIAKILQDKVNKIFKAKGTFLSSFSRNSNANTYSVAVKYAVKDPTIKGSKTNELDTQTLNTAVSFEDLDSIIESDKKNLLKTIKVADNSNVDIEVKKDYYFRCKHSGALSDDTQKNTDDELKADRTLLNTIVDHNTQVDVSWDDTSTALIKIPGTSCKEAVTTLKAIYNTPALDGLIIQTTTGKNGKSILNKYTPYMGNIESSIDTFNKINSAIYENFDNLMFMLITDIVSLKFDPNKKINLNNLSRNFSKLNTTLALVLQSMYTIARDNRSLQNTIHNILKHFFKTEDYNEYIQKETQYSADAVSIDVYKPNLPKIAEALQSLGVSPTYRCDSTQFKSLIDDNTLRYLINIYAEEIIKKQSKGKIIFEDDLVPMQDKAIHIGADEVGPDFLDETIKTTDPVKQGQKTPLSSLQVSDIIQKERSGGDLAKRTRYVLKRLINEALTLRGKYKIELHLDLTPLRAKIKKITYIFSFTQNTDIIKIRQSLSNELKDLFSIVNSRDDNELDDIILKLAKKESESLENKSTQDDSTYTSVLNKNKDYNINIGVYSGLFYENIKEGLDELTKKIDKLQNQVNEIQTRVKKTQNQENKNDSSLVIPDFVTDIIKQEKLDELASTTNENQPGEQKEKSIQTDINPVYVDYLNTYIDVSTFPIDSDPKKAIQNTITTGAMLFCQIIDTLKQMIPNEESNGKDQKNQDSNSTDTSDDLKLKIRKSLFENVDAIENGLSDKIRDAYKDVKIIFSEDKDPNTLSDEEQSKLNSFLNMCDESLARVSSENILNKRALALTELCGYIRFVLWDKTGKTDSLGKHYTPFNINSIIHKQKSNTETEKETQNQATTENPAKVDIENAKSEKRIREEVSPNTYYLSVKAEDELDARIRSIEDSVPKTEREIQGNVGVYRAYNDVYKADYFTNICKFYENRDDPNKSTLKLAKGYGFAEKTEIDRAIKAFEQKNVLKTEKDNIITAEITTTLKDVSQALTQKGLEKCIVCYIKDKPIKGIPPVVFTDSENGVDKFDFYLPYTIGEVKSYSYYTGYKYKCPTCNEETDCYLTDSAIKKAKSGEDSYLNCTKCRKRINLSADIINKLASDTNFLKKHEHVIHDNLDFNNPLYYNETGESIFECLLEKVINDVYDEADRVPPGEISTRDAYNISRDPIVRDTATEIDEEYVSELDNSYEIWKKQSNMRALTSKETSLLHNLYDIYKIPENIRDLSGQAHYWLDIPVTEMRTDFVKSKISDVLKLYRSEIDNALNLDDKTRDFIEADFKALAKRLVYYSTEQETPTKESIDYNNIFIKACEYGEIERVKLLLKTYEIDINALDAKSWTALMYASQKGHLDIVQELIKAGADVNVKGENDLTALMKASDNRHLKVVQTLIQAGADVNAKSKDNKTVLTYASEGGNVKIYAELIKAGAIVDTTSKDGIIALLIASSNGQLEKVKELIQAGVDVNAKGKNGLTALMEASGNGHLEVVQMLIQKGADVNAGAENGWTALMSASMRDYSEIVQALIAAGADVNTETKKEQTALMWASRFGCLNIVNTLIDAKADVNLLDGDGKTALIYAIKNKHFDIASVLLSKCNTMDESILTALQIARLVRAPADIIDKLSKAKKDISLKEKKERERNYPTKPVPEDNLQPQPPTGNLVEQKTQINSDDVEQKTQINSDDKDKNEKPEDPNKVTSSLGFTIYKSAKKHIVRK